MMGIFFISKFELSFLFATRTQILLHLEKFKT
jgi:hypothetical protein